jgi:methanogenic corrinoid protein MtbC1
VIIGGAPSTEEYAREIGADATAKDAVEGVRIVAQWSRE